MRASFFVRSLRWVIGAALLATSVPSCARTGLFVFGACEEEGAERSCDDACGTGTELCEDGTWGECTVPVTARACQNDCGAGTETCENHAWGGCEVPPVERACSDICGAGTEKCTDGRWASCEVPLVDFSCDNACGTGVQHCEHGKLSRCEVPVAERDCESVCGSGHERCVGGVWQACDAPQPNPPVLKAVLRDFSPTISPDFEWDLMGMNGDDRKIVEDVLGPDEKPVWSGDPSIHTVTSKETFDTWYRDVPGVNVHIDYDLALTASLTEPGFFVYDNQTFFPLDGDPRAYGNEGNPHDYHFTLEATLTFKYAGGELFGFTGDDDMWVFINRRLAINLGGLHESESASVSLDQAAGELELVRGETYPIHIFFAERHTYDSRFRLETSVADRGACPSMNNL